MRTLAVVALLASGVAVGIAADLVGGITGSMRVFVPATVLGVAIAVVFLVVLFVMHRRAKAQFEAGAGEAFGRLRTLGRALALRGREEESGRPPPDVDAALEAAFAAAPNAFTYWITGRAYWRLFLAIGSLIGAAVLVSQFVVLTEQARRLADQNQLIQLEVRLAAITRQADLEQQAAARAYDEITRILDENASVSAIVNALDRLPEAMVMPVTVVDSEWTPTPEDPTIVTRTVYPNLVPLAQQLLSFSKAQRPREGVEWNAEDIGFVSTRIAIALHRLGAADSDDAAGPSCVWHVVFDYYGVPRLDAGAQLNTLLDGSSSHRMLSSRVSQYIGEDDSIARMVIDLRHMRTGQLERVRFPGANLSQAELKGLNFTSADLVGAKLDHANLRESTLDRAQLRGSDFSSAKLWKAGMSEAQLQGAILRNAELYYARLDGAQFQGADLTSAKFQLANATHAEFQGAFFSMTAFHGTDLSGARFREERVGFLMSSELRQLRRLDTTELRPRQEHEILVEVECPPAHMELTFFGYVLQSRDHVTVLMKDKIHPLIGWHYNLQQAEEYFRQRQADKEVLRRKAEAQAPEVVNIVFDKPEPSIDEILSTLVRKPTVLKGAVTTGVLMPQDWLDFLYASPGLSEPPPAAVFTEVNTDPGARGSRLDTPYRFPSWYELLELSRDQTAKREKQASEAQSRP